MIPDTETHVEPHKTGHRWLDSALALCAIFISVTSLAVAIHHGRTMERMAQANARLVAANSWPYLQFVRSNGLVPSNLAGLALPAQAEFSTSWSIVNAGVGPARIESFELFWQGRRVHTIRDLISACCSPGNSSDGSELVTSSLDGIVLRAGETLPLLLVRRTPENEEIVERLDGLDMSSVTFRICYCSVFDECWITNLQTTRPEAVQQCPVEPESST